MNKIKNNFFIDHKICNKIVYPASAFLDKFEQKYKSIDNINFLNKLEMTYSNLKPDLNITTVNNQISAKIGDTDILKLNTELNNHKFKKINIDNNKTSQLNITDFYNFINYNGMNYGPLFRVIKSIYKKDNFIWGTVSSDTITDGFKVSPIILNACFQMCIAYNLNTMLPRKVTYYKSFKPTEINTVYDIKIEVLSETKFNIQLYHNDDIIVDIVEIEFASSDFTDRRLDDIHFTEYVEINNDTKYNLNDFFIIKNPTIMEFIEKCKNEDKILACFKKTQKNSIFNGFIKCYRNENPNKIIYYVQYEDKKQLNNITLGDQLDIIFIDDKPNTYKIRSDKICTDFEIISNNKIQLKPQFINFDEVEVNIKSIKLDASDNIYKFCGTILNTGMLVTKYKINDEVYGTTSIIKTKLVVNADELTNKSFDISNLKVFNINNEINMAFDYLKNNKVAILINNKLDLSGKHLITGGNGAIGKIVVDWLINNGAKKVYITSRNVEKNLSTKKIEYIKLDVSDENGMNDLFKKYKFNYVFHLAGIIDYTLINNINEDLIKKIFEPKLNGTNNILKHQDKFNKLVLFSSVSAFIAYNGLPGQSIYSSANAYLDNIALNNDKCMSIQWGPWNIEGSMIESLSLLDSLERSGTCSIDKISGLDGLHYMLNNGYKLGCITPFRFKNDLKINNMQLEDTIINIIKSILGPNAKIDLDKGFSEMGFDSMAMSEFAQNINKLLNTKLTPMTFYSYSTINKLLTYLSTNNKINYEIKKPISTSNNKIAIVSVGINLPGSDFNIDKLWELLLNKKNVTQEINGRFNFDKEYEGAYTKNGHLINNIEYFDNKLFDIEDYKAKVLDPQQKIALEVAWQTLYTYGYNKETLAGKKIGVFVGQTIHDWMKNFKEISTYSAVGTSPAITANHISYSLGLTGKSVTLDTACSSSLIACDYAINSILSGDCDEALVGGVNLLLDYEYFVALQQAKMLSPTGICHVFDESADGYSRGEGCAFILLKPLEKAIKDNDYIWGVIEGIGANQDGKSSVITAPNQLAQENLYLDVLGKSNLQPTDITFLATHGTGTKLGDPIEMGGISNIYGKRENNLYLGGIKANIGHTESTAGIANLIYCLLVMKNKQIPGVAGLNNINPLVVEVINEHIIIPKETIKLEDKKIYTAASSYGFGGTNSHIIMSSHTNKKELDYKYYKFNRNHFPIFTDTNKTNNLTANYNEIFDHKINSKIVFPGAGYLKIASNTYNSLSNIEFLEPLTFDNNENKIFTSTIINNRYQLIFDNNTHFAATISTSITSDNGIVPVNNGTNSVDIKQFYNGFKSIGIDYGPTFQVVKEVFHNDIECWATLNGNSFISIIDGVFQTTACLVNLTESYVPSKINYFNLINKNIPINTDIFSYVKLIDSDYKKCTFTFDIILYNNDSVFCQINGFQVKKILIPFNTNTSNFEWTINTTTNKISTTYDYLFINEEIECYPKLLSIRDELIKQKSILFVDNNVVSGLIGFVKTFQLEYPEIVVKYLYAENDDQINKEKELDGNYIKYENNVRYTSELKQHDNFYHINRTLYFNERGSLTNLHLTNTNRIKPLEDQIEIKVYIMYINKSFINDVLIYDKNKQKNKYIGIISNIGSAITDYNIGDIISIKTSANPSDYIIINKDNFKTNKKIAKNDFTNLINKNNMYKFENIIDILKNNDNTEEIILYNHKYLTGNFIITGGTGSLGQHAAKWLITSGADKIYLISRNGKEISKEISNKCTIINTDICKKKNVKELSKLENIKGIFHCAGILSDSMFINQTLDKYNDVYQPKVGSVKHLNNYFKNVDIFITYSSIASMIGSLGQINYSSINSHLDNIILERNKNGLSGTSIQWSAWSINGGMAKEDTIRRLKLEGLIPIDEQIGDAMLNKIIDLNGVYGCMPSKTKIIEDINIFVELKSKDEILTGITNIIYELLGNKNIENNKPFMEAGLDSLATSEFTRKIKDTYKINFSNTLLFNYSTIDTLTDYIYNEINKIVTEKKLKSNKLENNKIAIISVGINLPGSNENIDKLWNNILESRNFSEPNMRINYNKEHMYTNAGHLIDNIEEFDNNLFDINNTEAALMNPLQKGALECAYQTLYNYGYNKETLNGKKIGVFIGQMTNDWQDMINTNSTYLGTSIASSITSNRISYCLGLSGPSLTIDTACSSSLVACNYGIKSILNGESDEVLVGGVNLLLHENLYKVTCLANMLSKDGKCFTFDENANGYSRGEGFGFILLKPLEKAIKDNDYIWGVIEGSAVNQDGKSSVITAPNGLSQENLFNDVLSQTNLKSSDIDFIATHGTGTKLGDPVEANSIANVYGKDRTNNLYFGAIKTNIGHTEGTAGIANIILSLLVMQHKMVPPIANLININKLVEEAIENKQIVIPKESVKLEKDKIYTAASSYGFGGTNAHVIMSSYENKNLLDYKYYKFNRNHFPIFDNQLKINNNNINIIYNLIEDHIVNSNVVFPGAGYLEIILKYNDYKPINNIKFVDPLILKNKNSSLEIIKNNDELHLVSNKNIHFICQQNNHINNSIFIVPEYNTLNEYNIDKLYNDYIKSEINYGASFRVVKQILYNDTEVIANISAGSIMTLLDGIFHSCGCIFEKTGTYVPIELNEININKNIPLNIKVYSKITENVKECSYKIDSIIYDPNDNKLIYGNINGLILKKVLFDTKINTAHSKWQLLETNEHITYDFLFINVSTKYKNIDKLEKIIKSKFTNYFINIGDQFYQSMIDLKDKLLNEYKSILFIDLNIVTGLMGFVKTFNLETNKNMKYLYAETDKQIEHELNIGGTYIKYHDNKRLIENIEYEDDFYHINRKLFFNDRGSLSNLNLVASSRRKLLPDEIEVKVYASGLNFRDVLNILGQYPGNPGAIGSEYAGIVSDIGDNIKNFKIGDKVFGIKSDCLSDYIITDSTLLFHMNSDNFSFYASLPIISLTVEYGFYHLTNIKPNMNILIHAGAGAVGLIATQYALNTGCNVYITCSDNKKKYIDSRVKGISNSRNAELFNDEFKNIKFDIILNSLSGDFIKYSFDKLNKNGAFIEIGKNNIWSNKKVNKYRPDIKYNTVAIDHMINENPNLINKMMNTIINERKLVPINMTTFDFVDYKNAFMFLRDGLNVGKVILTNHKYLSGDYIIIGGTGELGQFTAKWLLSSGVNKIYLVSRNCKDEDINENIKHKCVTIKKDLSNKNDVKELLKMNNIKGIIHSAGMLKDGYFVNQTKENYEIVHKSKSLITTYLDKYSNKLNLDTFIVYSSLTSLLGNIGQTNYSTANSYQDKVIENRNNNGLVGVSIQWNAWSGKKSMASDAVIEQQLALGYIPINSYIGDAMLNKIINLNGVYGCIPKIKINNINDSKKEIKNNKVYNIDEIELIINNIVKELIGNNNVIDINSPLMNNGIDSLSSTELSNKLIKIFNIELSKTLLFSYPTIKTIRDMIFKELSKTSIIHKNSKYIVKYNKTNNDKIIDLTLINNEIGEIRFLGELSYDDIDLDNFEIENGSIQAYHNSEKPLIGSMLNRPSIITLYNYISKNNNITEDKLRKVFEKYNYTLIELDGYYDKLIYRVENF